MLKAPPIQHPQSFIGRADEISFCRNAVAALAAGRHSTILVAGTVGIGKSWFIQEVARLAHARGIPVLFGAAQEIGNAPLAPFRTVLTTTDTAQSGDDKLLTFAAALNELRRQGETAGLVAVIEDLQWADSQTLELFSYLSTAPRAPRILLIGTYRTGEPDGRRNLQFLQRHLARHKSFAQIDLEPLTHVESAALMRNALRGADRPAVETLARIETWSEGNPLFLIELARAASQGSPPSGGLRIPPSIGAPILDRFHRLSPPTRDFLKLAAALGVRWTSRDLERILGSDAQGTTRAIVEAESMQLITDLGDGDYRFTHALTRHTIYASILHAEQRALHVRIFEYLEAVLIPESPAVIDAPAYRPKILDAPAQRLSSREREIAMLILGGRTSKVIANELFLSQRTVDNHVASILRKLEVRTRAQIATRLLRVGT